MIAESFLDRILSEPAAPFREQRVAQTLLDFFQAEKIPHFRDAIGNIVVGAASKTDYIKKQRGKDPVRLFMAHMDHPGFHVEESVTGGYRARWFGGGAPFQNLEGTPMWLATEDEGFVGEGRITSPVQESGQLRGFTLSGADSVVGKRVRVFGSFKFRRTHWTEGDFIYTKAADDLVGCFVIASIAFQIYRAKRSKVRQQGFLGVLTRAEEVGFIGAISHLKLNWVNPKNAILVSLETSRTLPGAEFGKGPVVRLGDRASIFHSGFTQLLTEQARKILPNEFQRRVMDGGTCEATAGIAFGIPSIGLSIPLGNYHNHGYEGGPDSNGPDGPAPEFVHLKDVERLQRLCLSLLDPGLSWKDPHKNYRAGLLKSHLNYRKLL